MVWPHPVNQPEQNGPQKAHVSFANTWSLFPHFVGPPSRPGLGMPSFRGRRPAGGSHTSACLCSGTADPAGRKDRGVSNRGEWSSVWEGTCFLILT